MTIKFIGVNSKKWQLCKKKEKLPVLRFKI